MRQLIIGVLMLLAYIPVNAGTVIIDLSRRGVKPGRGDVSAAIAKVIGRLPVVTPGDTLKIVFAPGVYEFHPRKAVSRELYISNHDQDNPKKIGIDLRDADRVIMEGNGAELIFHGTMLPLSVENCRDVTIRNLSIDFANPHISQVRIAESSETDGITFRPEPWVRWRISGSGAFETYGEDWSHTPCSGIAFEPDIRRLVYRTSDLWTPLDSVIDAGDGLLRSPRWKDSRLKPGTVVALRTYARPTPGIFLGRDSNVRIENVTVHYAYGMGLLAQLCDNVSLDRFRVALRSEDDPRYFTTQADATHFSGCSGTVDSRNGFYEGMMDDAINVHGTYLRITGQTDSLTLTGRYMHPQTYGFEWGEAGDSVQLVLSRTMETFGEPNVIESITATDRPDARGAKEFSIRLRYPVALPDSCPAGIENLRLTPQVIFAGNTVRNNRARGSLFSTPRPVTVEDNIFDHTSGTAILLCGDCNGWFETGACRSVTIRRNRFINALTNQFQFTEAIISIYPEIPDLQAQSRPFHGGKDSEGIVISDNIFETFDTPLLYVKSTDGLRFTDNTIRRNSDYPAFHPNRYNYRVVRSRNVVIEDNSFTDGSTPSILIE